MRSKVFLCILTLAVVAYAKELKPYQTGKLLQMDSVKCGVDEKDAETFSSDVLGTGSGHKKTHELLCQEYLLQADSVIYRIRPRRKTSGIATGGEPGTIPSPKRQNASSRRRPGRQGARIRGGFHDASF